MVVVTLNFVGIILLFIGLGAAPDLGDLRISQGISVSILVLNIIVAACSLVASLVVYYFSNFGPWETRFKRLPLGKNLVLLSSLLVAGFSIWRLLAVFVHCQGAVDNKRVLDDAACWNHYDDILSGMMFHFFGALVIVLCQFALAYYAHKRHLEVFEFLLRVDGDPALTLKLAQSVR